LQFFSIYFFNSKSCVFIFFSIIFTDHIDISYNRSNGIANPICVTGSGGVKIAATASGIWKIIKK